MWDELARGAVGAIVLVDLRRPGDCYAAIDYFEDRRVPFAVAINQFPGSPAYSEDAVRDALALPPGCPLLRMDARASLSSLDTLIALVEHALVRRSLPGGVDREATSDDLGKTGPVVHGERPGRFLRN